MLATFRYVLITAVRDRLVAALLVALVAAVCAAMFLAASALAEQNAFGLAFAGEAIRLILGLGLITFISFHIRRMHETREIEAILSRPISRASFVLAYFVAYAAIAVFLSMAATGLLALSFVVAPGGVLEWGCSLALEMVIVVAIALFCAMSLDSATAAVLAGLGFYGLARLGATFRFIVENRPATIESDLANHAIRVLVTGISFVLPRADLFGQSRWLIYGAGGGWGLRELFFQTAVYAPLLLAATIRDLQTKQF